MMWLSGLALVGVSIASIAFGGGGGIVMGIICLPLALLVLSIGSTRS